MGNGKAAEREIGEDRLDVAKHRPALRRVPVVADGGMAGNALAQVTAEMLADEAHMAFGVEALAVEADDAARFLSAVLQGMQAERREQARFLVSEHAKYAALFAWLVVIIVEIGHRWVRLAGGAAVWAGYSSDYPPAKGQICHGVHVFKGSAFRASATGSAQDE